MKWPGFRTVEFWKGFFGIFLVAASVLVGFQWVSAQNLKHDFSGRCQSCHEQTPEAGASFERSFLKEGLDSVCAQCHALKDKLSHPVGVRPSSQIPLSKFLDGQGRLTCVTCHQVHKDRDTTLSQDKIRGFLRGHVSGRSFCATCHRQDTLGARWNHKLSVSYAHASSTFKERSGGSPLDEESAECLSCHDGVISKMKPVQVMSGSFRHGIGLSHPIGVTYPVSGAPNEFKPASSLPKEIRLFNGKVGCMSCHSPYGKKKALLSMDNKKSALCFACHIK